MADQAPAPQYVPPPRGSGAGLVVGILVGVFLLAAMCGLGLLGFGLLAYQAVEVQAPPVIMPAPVPTLEPIETKVEPEPASETPQTPATDSGPAAPGSAP